MNIKDLDFEKSGGLIPAIVQDTQSGQVLMLGFMNEEAVNKTLDTGLVTFYSRSRKQLWTKGDTSGNRLHLVDIQMDCDSDSLLVMVNADGPTCHTGEVSCFHEHPFSPDWNADDGFLTELEALLYDRKMKLPEDSYTSKMFKKGLDKIAQKVGEEAVETVIASKNDDEKEFIYESSDLLFHLMLLLVQKDIPFKKLVQELARRHSVDHK